VIASGLERLVAAGVELELRPHHLEDAGRYRQLLDTRDIDVKLVPGGSFAAAAARTDILIASTSSVAFEAAALGLPVLLWQGVGPRWFRGEHLVPPWIEHAPGMFATSDEFAALVEDLLLRPEVAFELAHGLGRHLAHYAAPFRPDSFAAGLLEIAA
jgi:glycosyltransferase involved in cell wall biosynthesis